MEDSTRQKARGVAPAPPPVERRRRLERVRDGLRERDLDGLAVYGSGAVNHDPVRYLANFVHVFPREQSVLFLPRTGEPVLLVDREWDLDRARETTWVDDVRPLPGGPTVTTDDLVPALERGVADAGLESSRLGIFEGATPVTYARALARAAPDASLVDGTPVWHDLVSTPTDYDATRVERAAATADAGLDAVVSTCASGTTEREICLTALATMARRGAEFVHGSPISTHVDVGAGAAAASNLQPFLFTERRLEEGEMFWVDLIASHDGFYVDCDRTVCVGEPSPEQRALYEVCREMHERMCAAIEPGVTGGELWDVGQRVADEAGYGEYVNAVHLGHTTGATIAAAPTASPGATGRLEAGQFFNVEPGIMHPTVGSACIETTHRVTDDGSVPVTDFDTGLHVV